jgi:hypothetical protein
LEESIEIENLIGKLSSNQQIINMSEYVNLHHKVKEIIKFFKDSQLMDKEDFISNMKKLMYRGFKVYEESFYVILKRYDLLDVNPNTENERMNLLNKIRSLAECLQDELIQFDFTSKLIKDKSEKIVQKLDDVKLNHSLKSINEDNYEKNVCSTTNLLIESEKLFQSEKDYILKILDSCPNELKNNVYAKIISAPLEMILQNLKELVNKHNKSNLKRIDFYQNIDTLNIWNEKIQHSYKNLVERYNKEIYQNINSIMEAIEAFCFNFVDNFMKDIINLNEKIENENVLKICNDTIFFLSNLLI